jgi:CHAT domain-containing protein
LADTQIEQHKYMEADQTLDRAAAVQDAMIETADSDLGKRALIKGANDLYAKHFALIADHGDNKAKAFAVVEQARGRVMTDLLMSGAKTSPEAIADENRIAQLRLKLMAATSIREVEQLREAIFLAEQSRSIIPQMSILKGKERQTIALTQLEHNLAPSEAVLEYVVDDPDSYCLAITRTQYRIVKLPGKQTISLEVAAYLREVKAKHAARSEAHKLYETLLRPIPESRSKEHLVIVRDGQLHLVPFDALIGTNNQYVVESHTVSYAPSATTFFLLRTVVRSQDQPPGLVAVGGIPYDRSGLKQSAVTRGFSDAGLSDLPTSEEEARAAVETLPDPSNVLLVGNEATETAFKKSIDHRMIHLAVHAIASLGQPDRAALVLLSDPPNGEDGFLETSEIVQLPLNADLVVLSACDTAVGPIEGEEGIVTLSRAFLLGGARTVVSTLWPIEDDTTLYLMKSFYVALARTRSAPDALRIAKRKMLETFGSDQALPYYWAGFTVEGFAAPPTEH